MKLFIVLVPICVVAAFLSIALVNCDNREVLLIIPNNFVGLISIKENINSSKPNPKALKTSNVYEYTLSINNNVSTVHNLQHLLDAKTIVASYEWVEPVDCTIMEKLNNEVLIEIKRL